MNKAEFLAALAGRINALPQEDTQRSLDYYAEMIDDRMDDGMTEEEAVAALGSLDEIVYEIMEDVPLRTLVKAKATPSRSLRGWEIALLILGAPIWLNLLLAAVIVLLAVYFVLWIVVASLYIVTFSLAASAVMGLVMTLPLLVQGEGVRALFSLGTALVCGGLAVLLFFGSNAVARAIARFSKRIFLWVKSKFARKEARA